MVERQEEEEDGARWGGEHNNKITLTLLRL